MKLMSAGLLAGALALAIPNSAHASLTNAGYGDCIVSGVVASITTRLVYPAPNSPSGFAQEGLLIPSVETIMVVTYGLGSQAVKFTTFAWVKVKEGDTTFLNLPASKCKGEAVAAVLN